MTDPLDTIRAEYSHRHEAGVVSRYSIWKSDVLFREQELQRAVIAMLSRNHFESLGSIRVVDVGCGSGGLLRDFIEYGADPDNLTGIDLMPERIEEARALAPHLDLRVGNAAELPFDTDSVDLALAFMVFSSIPDPGLRTHVADEVVRVLRPGGALLWYDFWVNPVNSAVVALGTDEMRRLFGRDPVDKRRVTLAPPISRRLARHSLVACHVLGKIPLLRTHWLALIRP